MSNNDELLGKIFEMVNTKAEAKPKKKRKPMTPEQRERCLANLKKGRETSLRKRQAKKAGKQQTEPQTPVEKPQPEPQTPVEKPGPEPQTPVAKPQPEPEPPQPAPALQPQAHRALNDLKISEGPLTISTFGGGMLW